MLDPITILLVDDEHRNLDALEAILGNPEYHLLRADDADKALKLLLANDVAAIVLDIKMPVVSGFELAKMIKGTKKFRQIPIVFLTAHLLDDNDVLTGYGAGAVDYLTKPVNPEILRHKIAIFAELYRKTRALAELNDTLEQRVRERTAELQKSEEALRASSKQKDLFLATLAHELRNPLAPLRTGLGILLQQPEPSTIASRTLAAMNRQLDHMVRLIDDLLDVSRINRGKLEVRLEPTELSAVIERAVEASQPLMERRKQQAVVSTEAVWANVDATRIAQVVTNLLNNASKYSANGSTIRLNLRADADTAVVEVADDGAGIPVEQLDRVFEMFAKVERSVQGVNDGLGIGLALSRQLAEMHGGTLSGASPGEGKGATFTLSLPRTMAAAPVMPTKAADETVGALSLRIAIVEDNEDAAEAMGTMLQLLGHEVHMANTGPSGLALILERRPDAVLCDVGLPGYDGVELCRRLREADTERPFMIALTGWGMESDRRRTAEAGFQHHLVKPVSMDELQRMLEKVQSVRLGVTASAS